MTRDQHIAELRAELEGCLSSKVERAQIVAELAALAERSRQDDKSGEEFQQIAA